MAQVSPSVSETAMHVQVLESWRNLWRNHKFVN